MNRATQPETWQFWGLILSCSTCSQGSRGFCLPEVSPIISKILSVKPWMATLSKHSNWGCCCNTYKDREWEPHWASRTACMNCFWSWSFSNKIDILANVLDPFTFRCPWPLEDFKLLHFWLCTCYPKCAFAFLFQSAFNRDENCQLNQSPGLF